MKASFDKVLYDDIEQKLMKTHPAYKSRDADIKELLKIRKKMTKVLFKGIEPSVDINYFCEICGSHSHLEHPDTTYCFICNTDNWKKEDYADI